MRRRRTATVRAAGLWRHNMRTVSDGRGHSKMASTETFLVLPERESVAVLNVYEEVGHASLSRVNVEILNTCGRDMCRRHLAPKKEMASCAPKRKKNRVPYLKREKRNPYRITLLAICPSVYQDPFSQERVERVRVPVAYSLFHYPTLPSVSPLSSQLAQFPSIRYPIYNQGADNALVTFFLRLCAQGQQRQYVSAEGIGLSLDEINRQRDASLQREQYRDRNPERDRDKSLPIFTPGKAGGKPAVHQSQVYSATEASPLNFRKCIFGTPVPKVGPRRSSPSLQPPTPPVGAPDATYDGVAVRLTKSALGGLKPTLRCMRRVLHFN
ncbi:hypothetical protein EVAR_55676_1 [Eumeta japonica]|uniref:Uncharacterized protein n=1 Tax=Eumeta variegata TaxID=151549 RepID=A0A4C1ZFQ8_EUMVA|nr:hypothetical protein EVAR_55676_1 [Eumeta japonica]